MWFVPFLLSLTVAVHPGPQTAVDASGRPVASPNVAYHLDEFKTVPTQASVDACASEADAVFWKTHSGGVMGGSIGPKAGLAFRDCLGKKGHELR